MNAKEWVEQVCFLLWCFGLSAIRQDCAPPSSTQPGFEPMTSGSWLKYHGLPLRFFRPHSHQFNKMNCHAHTSILDDWNEYAPHLRWTDAQQLMRICLFVCFFVSRAILLTLNHGDLFLTSNDIHLSQKHNQPPCTETPLSLRLDSLPMPH